ncbi:hypothetical protein M0813_22645 [Anaeramoeba flamelloides]|uniref:PPM-type phosphatase domain-containing protein n=1 Tax=Anaeramoeba flamelloides TaxID=1746091 RepID=A0ABQ8YD59_9EUKA|nr:hypothetical protein M0813_22645 [Anaeramoeba flamelloides]
MGNDIKVNTNSKVLFLTGRKLRSIPQSISQCSELTHLNVSNNQIKTIPKKITKLKSLKNLNLSLNFMKSLPNNIYLFQTVTDFNLSLNFLKDLSPRIRGLTNLESLNLRTNVLVSLPQEIGELKNLKNLDLGKNKLKTVPLGILGCTKLGELYLDENQLTELPDGFGSSLANLRTLQLSYNDFEIFPSKESLKGLVGLEYLSINCCKLKEIGGSVSKLKSVNKIIARMNRITTISPKIGKLATLNSLNLQGNCLKSLPDEIMDLSNNLKSLNLFFNHFTQFPIQLFSLKVLNEILIYGNKINEIPPFPEFCKNLIKLKKKKLSLNENENERDQEIDKEEEIEKKIEKEKENEKEIKKGTEKEIEIEIEKEKAQEKEKEKEKEKEIEKEEKKENKQELSIDLVSELDLGQNKLKQIPDDLFLLTPRIVRLFLHENKLKKLPTSFRYLDRVITLFAQTNQIQAIPKEINQLSNLLELNLMNNLIKKVPVELYSCKRLIKLNLSNNLLTDLPKGMYKLYSLDTLNLSANKFTKFPSIVITLQRLRILSIGSNEIKAIPDIVNELKFLKELNASCNKLYFIPSGLGYLKNFTTLNLSDNKISQVPELFWELRAPTNYGLHIDLSHNRIQTFDEGWKLLNLEELDLSHNRIKAIDPQILSNLSKVLETFKISHNKIKDLDLMGLAHLKNLKLLHFEGNKLTKGFENFIYQFTKTSQNFANEFSNLQQMIVPRYVQLAFPTQVLKRKFNLPKKYRFKVGYSEMQGFRPEQEDSIAIQNRKESNIHYFAVFDGHAGWQTSNYVADTLDQIIFSQIVNKIPFTLDEAGDQELKIIIDNIFVGMNKLLKKLGYDDSGSTACIGLVIENTLYTINLGDSRSVLVKVDGETVPVTKDHKPTDRSELDRVRELGGVVTENGRINGGIAVSRSFGDSFYQPFVSCEPTIKRYSLSEKRDKFLVLCCDGVYDVLSNQEVGQIVYNNYLNGNTNMDNIATQIRNVSYSKGSLDNISVIVVDLFPKIPLESKEKVEVKEIDENVEMEIAKKERIEFGKPESPIENNQEKNKSIGVVDVNVDEIQEEGQDVGEKVKEDEKGGESKYKENNDKKKKSEEDENKNEDSKQKKIVEDEEREEN